MASSIAKGLKKRDLVSLSTTVPPCITEEFLLPILKKKSRVRYIVRDKGCDDHELRDFSRYREHLLVSHWKGTGML